MFNQEVWQNKNTARPYYIVPYIFTLFSWRFIDFFFMVKNYTYFRSDKGEEEQKQEY